MRPQFACMVLNDQGQAHRRLVPPLALFYIRRRRGEVYALRMRHAPRGGS